MDKRFSHNTPSLHATTMDLGLLYPIDFIDIPIGQTTSLKYSAVFRFQPLLAPAFEKITAHFVSFFVPYRLLWEDYLEFISGIQNLELPTTRLFAQGSAFEIGNFDFSKTLLDYFGFPVEFGGVGASLDLNFNYFPFLAYYKIWNEHFRDTEIQREIDLTQLTQDFITGISYSNSSQWNTAFKKLYGLKRVNWGKDRFTSALLETEADPSIQLPVGANGPFTFIGSRPQEIHLRTVDMYNQAGNKVIKARENVSTDSDLMYKSGLAGIDMSDFKLATSIWNFMVNKNIYGRDVEGYFKKYGLRNQDLRLQRSEVIGGFSEVMQISDILATDGTDLGKQGGHAVGIAKNNGFKHFAFEPGLIMTMAYLRPSANYSGGIPRYFFKRDMLDFPQKEFMNIGYQPVYKQEIGISTGSPTLPKDENAIPIFGYEQRYNEYRSRPNMITGELRPGKPLSHWANPRNFTAEPNLNSDFLECNPSNQIWASPTTDKAVVGIRRKVVQKNFVPKFTSPKIKL